MRYFVVENNTVTNVVEAGPGFAERVGAIPGPDEADIGWSCIDGVFSAPAEEQAPPAFATADEAKDAMRVWIEAFTASITGQVPIDEKLSWDAKESAARAWLAGNPSERETALIMGESSITGESPEVLVGKIVANADVYRLIVASVAGLRRKTSAALDAVSDPYDYAIVLGQAQAQATVMAAQLGIS